MKESTSGCTSFTVSLSRILANALVGIENESRGAGDEIVLTVGAEVELVANLIGATEKAGVGQRFRSKRYDSVHVNLLLEMGCGK